MRSSIVGAVQACAYSVYVIKGEEETEEKKRRMAIVENELLL